MRQEPNKLMIALFCFCMIHGPAGLFADEGHPVAIRYWPEQAVTVETMWNFHIGLRNGDAPDVLPRTPDLELRLEKQESAGRPESVHVHAWAGSESHEFVLDRKPNEEQPTWMPAEKSEDRSDNSVLVWHIPVALETALGKPAFVSMIAVDGVRIVDAGGATAEAFLAAMRASPAHVRMLPSLDAILVTGPRPDAESLKGIAELMKPRRIVIAADSGLESVGDETIRSIPHNTLALSAASEETFMTQFVSLRETRWEMSDDLAGLYAKKEAACESSREVFAALSAEQMNFVPGDGTHTPRWNAEHMMGRELGFFSQIYSAIDPSIPVMDLNPEQMPDDYQAAHPDWNGAEEALQMERVEHFNRRFAYLLDGIDLDGRIKGNPFPSLRALLVQMDRHYREHTGNVEKKMKLPNWPAN